MKKKIKDLTKKDLEVYCDTHTCDTCPLHIESKGGGLCVGQLSILMNKKINIRERVTIKEKEES